MKAERGTLSSIFFQLSCSSFIFFSVFTILILSRFEKEVESAVPKRLYGIKSNMPSVRPLVGFLSPLDSSSEHLNSSSYQSNSEEKCIKGEEEEKAEKYLNSIEKTYSDECFKSELATWEYSINENNETEEASAEAETAFNNYQAKIQSEILSEFPSWRTLSCPSIRRQFKLLTREGPGTMPSDRIENMNKIKGEMESLYSKTTICDYHNSTNCELRLDPEITDILKTSRDYNELEHCWTGWHNAMSEAIPAKRFHEFISLRNEKARANGFNNSIDEWADNYNDGTEGWTSNTLKSQIKSTWESLRPYYMKLHAFVRMKLKKFYRQKSNSSDETVVKRDRRSNSNPPSIEPIQLYHRKEHSGLLNKQGYIPAHILGDIFSAEWDNIENIARPYPDAESFDVSAALVNDNYTVLKMFETADKFFQDLGLLPMNQGFWKNSMFERTEGKLPSCDPVAYDLCLKTNKGETGDYRIKICAEVNQFFFEAIHHEMGHVQYYMQYSHLPQIFRTGANLAFHEAIGDALTLGVSTPKHLHCVLGFDMGFPVDCESSKRTEITASDINLIFRRSLNSIAFLPFSIGVELWRWEVLSETIGPEQYNDRWWQIRKDYQGIIPESRRPSGGFDPAAKSHILSGDEFIRYYFSALLQFQFYQGMCVAAGEYNPKDENSKPLYQCDFSGNKKAGSVLAGMMIEGGSKPWPDALEMITGSRTLSVEPIINYFKPLFDKITTDLQLAKEKPCFAQHCLPILHNTKFTIKPPNENEDDLW